MKTTVQYYSIIIPDISYKNNILFDKIILFNGNKNIIICTHTCLQFIIYGSLNNGS